MIDELNNQPQKIPTGSILFTIMILVSFCAGKCVGYL